MAKYRNKKNGRVMEIIQEDKKYKTVLVRFEDNDEETQISTSTLKRWYEELDDEDEDYEDDDEELEEDDEEEEDEDSEDEDDEEDEDDSDEEEDDDEDEDSDDDEEDEDSDDEDEDEDQEEEDEDDDSDEDDEDDEDSEEEEVDDDEDEQDDDEDDDEEEEPAPKKGKSSTKNAPKSKEKKAAAPRKKSEESDAVKELVDYAEECVKEQDGEIFQPQSQPRNRAFKVGGHMYARLLYSVKAVTVACRKEAVSGTGIKPTKTINHMFSELYTYEKLDKTAKANIKKLLQASFDYQLKKNQGTDKPKAKKEKAASKKEAKTSTKSKATGKKNSKKEK